MATASFSRPILVTQPKTVSKRKASWKTLWSLHKQFAWPFKPIPFTIVFVSVSLFKLGFETMHYLYVGYKLITKS